MDEDYYDIKRVNDILFNNQISEHYSTSMLKKKKKEGKLTNPNKIGSKELD